MRKLEIISLLILLFYLFVPSGCEKSKKTVEPDGNNNQEPGTPTLSISKQTAGFDEGYELSFSAEEAVSYLVQENMNPQFSNPMRFPSDSTKKSFSHKVDSPTLFYYRVQGISGADSSGWSQVVSITVNPLERPSGFVSEEYCLSGQEYTLSWTRVNKAQSYTIEEATEKYFINPSVLNTQDSLLTISRNVQSIQNFYYRVKAVHEDFVSPWSDTLKTVVLPLVLSAPEFTETSPTSYSGEMYSIYWSDTGLSYTLEEATNSSFTNVNSYQLNDTATFFNHLRREGKRFYYRVKSHGITGQNDSPWSNTFEVSIVGRIVFATDRDGNSEIYRMHTDGTDQINMTNNPGVDMEPSWSPDVTQIAFTSNRDGNREVYLMDEDGTNQKNITNHIDQDFDPAWSPDGLQIVFTSDRDGRYEIYVMNADGTNQKNISNHPDFDYEPAWSPDGSQIAFVSERDGNREIYIMNTDGTNQRNLTNSSWNDEYPSWSPDGTIIAFSSCRDGYDYNCRQNIYLMDINGMNEIKLTNKSWALCETSWTPDGIKIVFSALKDIYLMNADGTNWINLTNNPAYYRHPSWPPD